MVHLFGACRQLGFAAAVNYDGLGSETFGRADGVHGHISSADNYGPPAGEYRGVVMAVVCLHQVGAR